MFKPTKLHPITYISKIISAIRSNFVLIAMGLFSLINGGIESFSIKEYGFPIVVLIITMLTIIYQIIVGFKTRYWIEDDKIILESGVFTKTVKELYISRIQSIDINKNLINQIFGGVILEVKTAGDGIKLDSISTHSADALTNYLESRKNILLNDSIHHEEQLAENQQPIPQLSTTTNEQFNEVFRLSTKDILLMSVTSGSFLTVLALINGLYSQLGEFLKIENYISSFEKMAASTISFYIIVGAILLVVSYIIGIFITALKYFNYQLMYDGERLKIRHGLFEVKEKILVVNQIQALTEKRSFIRQWLGFTSFEATIQSDSEDLSDITGHVEVLPFITRKNGLEVMRQLVPHYHYGEVNKVIPIRSLRRYFQIQWLIIIILTSVVQYFWFKYAWIVGLILLGITFLTSYMRYKHSGYDLLNDQITVRWVSLLKSETNYIKDDKIIEMNYKDNYFLKRAQLATLDIKNSAGAIFMVSQLALIDKNDAIKIIDWFVKKEEDQYETRR